MFQSGASVEPVSLLSHGVVTEGGEGVRASALNVHIINQPPVFPYTPAPEYVPNVDYQQQPPPVVSMQNYHQQLPYQPHSLYAHHHPAQVYQPTSHQQYFDQANLQQQQQQQQLPAVSSTNNVPYSVAKIVPYEKW